MSNVAALLSIFGRAVLLHFAAKIVKTIFDEVESKRLIGSLATMGAGVEDASNRSDCGEKNEGDPLV